MARRRSRKTGDWHPVEGFDDLPPVLRDEGAFLAKPLKQTAGLHRDTYPLLAETHADLARLDEAVHRSPGGPALILVTRLLDIQGGAELSGEFAGLREIFMLDVPNPTGPAVDEQFRHRLDFCRAAVALTQSGQAVDMTLFNDATIASAAVAATEGIRWRNGSWWLGGLESADATLIGAPPDRRMVTQTLKCLAWMDSRPTMPLIAQLGVVNAQLATLAPLADLDDLFRGMVGGGEARASMIVL